MLYFPINTVFIEGPDCAGKTTLINNLHKMTDYRWHLFDRSHLSRKLFSELYGRNTLFINDAFEKEVNNLNNMYVMLLPTFDEIEKRFNKRGDEIHNIDTLRKVYDKFSSVSKAVSSRPNVLVYESQSNSEKLCENLYVYLDLVERPLLREISDIVKKNVQSSSDEETYPLEFTVVDDGSFQEADSDSMNYPPERDYYHEIYNRLHEKIDKELAGDNEYKRREDFESRRFVYADTTCISFIQVAVRDNTLDFHTVIRSSNVDQVLEHDIRFLYFLASTCYKKFSDKCSSVRMRFNLNSAHIL
jgi:hypothetical protein